MLDCQESKFSRPACSKSITQRSIKKKTIMIMMMMMMMIVGAAMTLIGTVNLRVAED
jgi:hypothetical protein